MSDQMTRPMNLLLAAACLFIIMFGIKASAAITNPILLAVIITIAVLPMPTRLRQRGMSGRLALLLTILAVVGVMLAVILLFVGGLHRLSVKIPTYADDIATRSAEFATWFEATTTTSPSVDSQQVSSLMTAVIGAIGGIIVQVFMTLLIFIFMISAAITRKPQKEMALATADPVVNRVNDFTRDVRQYLTVTTVINMLVGLEDETKMCEAFGVMEGT
jgi:AI-2 transport protein TqsA